MSENSKLIELLKSYYNSEIYDFQLFKKEVELMKDEEKERWVIETDRGQKPLKEYQWKLLNQIYSIFQVGQNQKFPGCNQSGAIYGSWRLKKSKINSERDVCNIVLFRPEDKEEYEYYHINVTTGKIRKISKIENTDRKSEAETDGESEAETDGESEEINNYSLRKSTRKERRYRPY